MELFYIIVSKKIEDAQICEMGATVTPTASRFISLDLEQTLEKHVSKRRLDCTTSYSRRLSFSNEVNYMHSTSQYIYLNFSTCFGQLCDHHQENLTVSMRHWYFSLCMGGCLVCRPDSHPYRVKNTSDA